MWKIPKTIDPNQYVELKETVKDPEILEIWVS